MDIPGDYEKIKSGYVMILGLPNVGKSTLMNRMVEEKLAIVTPKPQTTRNRILGIAQGRDYQILFLDTPGVCQGNTPLNKFLLSEIDLAFADADMICFMTEAHREITGREKEIIERLKTFAGPVFCLINKVDKVSKPEMLPKIEQLATMHKFDEIIPLSALKADNCSALFKQVLRYMPYGPRYYPEGDLSDVTERFMAAEYIREKVFLNTRQEIPYSTAVMVQEFKEDDECIRITADVVVERESQKGIVIGKGALMLKKIGIEARLDLEKVFDKTVHLKLFVKVSQDWSKDSTKLRELGYNN